jgi:hypothetical protein
MDEIENFVNDYDPLKLVNGEAQLDHFVIDLFQYHGLSHNIIGYLHERLLQIHQGLKDGTIEPNHSSDYHLVKVLCCGYDQEQIYVGDATLYQYVRDHLERDLE